MRNAAQRVRISILTVRTLPAVAGLVALVGALAGLKASQISSLINMGKKFQQAGPPPETVSVTHAQLQPWEGTMTTVGSVAAARGVSVSNDAPGVVTRILFESGQIVRAGQTLVVLEASAEHAQLASARARRKLAELTASRSRTLVHNDVIAPAQLDSDEAQLKTATTDEAALQAVIDRKVVRAPFSGRLGIRAINLGQYLSPGTPIAMLEAIDTVFVDFTLPQQRLADARVGLPVRIAVDAQQSGKAPSIEGVITAVDPQVDQATRTIKLRASVPNHEEKLRPGMFVTVAVVLPAQAPVIAIPATALLHASFGDTVFVVEDKADPKGGPPLKVARQQFVRPGEARGDFVSIVEGLSAGQTVVSAGAFKLRNGSTLVINDDVKLDPQIAPKVQNR
ncbi:MAG: efflux RND transporter periplasmic adaptor subunit [Deltaproteobacteria bacterium]|nr:efflux RND transporter periplasmic adaptor subunit [Deltaproteobacteria bacterium]